MKNKIIFLIIFISLITIFSCSVSTPFFIQNTTENEIELKIIYNKNIKDLINHGDYNIVYQNGVKTPKEFLKSKESIDIKKSQTNDSTLIIYIPSYSTVRIARTGNHYFMNEINSVSYHNKEYSMQEIFKNSKSKNWSITYKIE